MKNHSQQHLRQQLYSDINVKCVDKTNNKTLNTSPQITYKYPPVKKKCHTKKPPQKPNQHNRHYTFVRHTKNTLTRMWKTKRAFGLTNYCTHAQKKTTTTRTLYIYIHEIYMYKWILPQEFANRDTNTKNRMIGVVIVTLFRHNSGASNDQQ